MEPLTVLLVGNGGREHALAWKLAQSPRVGRILAVPGNGGTASTAKTENVAATTATAEDFASLVALARRENVGLVVPGPEAPLVAGIVDTFRDAGIACFGPSKAAARLEASKAFSKDFMQRHSIPTAAYRNFRDFDAACRYVEQLVPADRRPTPETAVPAVVIKADGIAAGKGVILPHTRQEALAALRAIMVDLEFGAAAGAEVVIEEFLDGDELSILTFCDGHSFRSLPAAQDHKRIFDGDRGPNTGGMGCYAPTALATPALLELVDRDILQPTIAGMRKEWAPFRGILFTGLMISPAGVPKVLEYNVRFGDPETQTVLPLLSSDTDLAQVMLACCHGCLDAVDIHTENRFSATVVVAAPGYPGSYPKGTPMTVGEPAVGSDISIFHAGTTRDPVSGALKTAGGRVIAATATAETLEAAVAKAYAHGLPLIRFDGMQFRKDIAHRAFRKSSPSVAAAPTSLSYADAGVSIEAGNQLVQRIKKAVASTAIPGADAEIGGFGGEVDLAKANLTSSALPIIVGAIDGVGTKLKIALDIGKHDTVGIDLVAMNVNDLVVQGARPLMFLDYIGCSRLNSDVAAAFVEGVAAGCRESGCALVGGETAEMPGMYQDDEYDAAGAAIGVMHESARLPRTADLVAGDVLLGLASSGVHSNGFSLVRRIVDRSGLPYSSPVPWSTAGTAAAGATTLGAALLTPTRIYVRSLLQVVERIKGLAHITGGGLTENVPRMLPDHLSASIDVASWPVPPVFAWLRQQGNVVPPEMARTFNNGIGMVLAAAPEEVAHVTATLEAAGERIFRIGQLVPRGDDHGCILTNLDTWA
ncbi:bifunctional purine biosynthesis protein [Grosmannia clavigera kw1407]|uniref:Bifunctional purine biosynthesis protein n=1 Tax=Grosmannia clavigera (strain kw1407 / UAMH 11150) TaxID=655863 RepID=F0XPN8_GROCL|nr:bifunctional purine biosynthesis protein [Grosmannia clavigera kw1407]EFX00159.1 bifunctional purine biosynthesis protein [Grosmannia clavigera kw1407]